MASEQVNALYVEDDKLSRRVLQMMAEDAGITGLTLFEDSANILERAQALDPKPDVIFLDIHIKPYSGFEMLKILRGSSHFDDIPIVAMTASVMNEEVAQLREAGFNACLAKPLDMETFPEMLKRILEGESIWRIVG